MEDDDAWRLHEPELSLKIWQMCESFDWRILPFPGSLLEQPEWFIEDSMILNWLNRIVRRDMGLDRKPKQGGEF